MINFKKTAAFLTAIICVMSMCSCEKEQSESAETQQSSITVMTDAEQANDSDASDNAITKEDRSEEKTDDPDEEETATSDNSDEEVNAVEEALVKAEETTVTAAEQTKKNAVIFDGNNITYSGKGAEINGSTITITSSGTYYFSGSLSDGQIIVDSDDDGTVSLVLNGVDITGLNNAPIYIANAEETVITLADGSKNILTDGSTRSDEEITGALYSSDDLTLTGSGSLTVTANYNDGIVCKDTLKIIGGSYTVKSADDGIIGKDCIIIAGGTFNINAEGDGFKSTNDSDTSLGYIAVSDGTFNITAGADGIQAETNILIENGKFTITTGGGSAKASKKNDFGGSSSSEDTSSAKGLKAGSTIAVKNGTFTFDTLDDSVHSNSKVNISGGTFNISSGDDAIHADEVLNISVGKITVSNSYEGLEASEITISGGTIDITASDDGINAAGKNDVESFFDIGSSSNNNILTISGGIVKVDASGDGLDANGPIYITGGEVFVNGPENDGNGALDYNNTFEISDGILVCVGSSGMAQSPSSSSEQSFVATNNVSGSAGSVITVKDSSGNEIYSYTTSKKFASVVFSSSKIKSGESYTISVDGSNDVTVTAGTELGGFGGFGGNGGFGGGPRGDFNGDPPDNNFGRNGTPPDNNFGGSGTPTDFQNKRNDATIQ